MAYESNAIFWIEVEKIVPNPYQPRREFDEKKLRELSDSIRMYGVLQPLVVTRREIMKENGAFTTEYELIAGERRLRASRLAGLAQVPVIIRTGDESDLMKLELAIIENLQREDLNPVDRALAFKQLAEAFGFSHVQVAEKVGRSREYVSNSIRLLQLPETILNALRANDISDGHARTLLMLNDRPEEQDIVFREILLKKLSVREVERISRKIATEKVRKKHWVDGDPELQAMEREFTETLGTRVQILRTDYGGRVTIDYFSPEELRKMLDALHRGEVEEKPTMNERETLMKIAGATPLMPAAPQTPVPPPVSPQPISPSAPVTSYPVSAPATFAMPTAVAGASLVQDTVPAPAPSFTPQPIPQPPAPLSAPQSFVSPDISLTALPQSEESPVTPFDSGEIPDEEVFTRHDTIEMPPTPPEVLDTEIAHEEDDASEDLYSIKNFSL
jgi:ParB family transcriptional regulator, chromosome partitioning protein